MKNVQDAVETLRKEIEAWDSPFVEADCFGTDNARRIVSLLEEFCQNQLGSGILGYFFYHASVGSAHGIRLEDGRHIVIKVRPPPDTNPNLRLDRKSLKTICDVMTWLSDRGYPSPKILLALTPLAIGLATVEEFLDAGKRDGGFDPECRKIIATGLAEIVELLRYFRGDPSGLQHFKPGASLYPPPHSKLFNFKKTAKGA